MPYDLLCAHLPISQDFRDSPTHNQPWALAKEISLHRATVSEPPTSRIHAESRPVVTIHALHCYPFSTCRKRYETEDLASLVPRRDHALRCILRDAMNDPAGARRSLFLAVQSAKKEGECKPG